MSSVYFNKGENCIAAGRLFVEESIHDEYITRVVGVRQNTLLSLFPDRNKIHSPTEFLMH